MLSFLFRLFHRFQTQDEVTTDMQLTFEEARADARAGGWWSYARFAAREMGGLFRLPDRNRWWLKAAGWGLSGLAAGSLAAMFWPAQYTSEGTLIMEPSVISQDLLPRDTFDLNGLLEAELPAVRSRAVMTSVMTVYGLFPETRKRQSMEDAVEEMRNSMHVERTGTNVVRVAFTYGDRHLAQRVTQDLLARLIDKASRTRSAQVSGTVGFFQDRADQIGTAWADLNTTLQTTPATDPHYNMLVLARDRRRAEYELVEQKLGDAETLKQLNVRAEDRYLMILDPASLPAQSDTPPWSFRLGGLGCGLGLWLLSLLWRALWRTPRRTTGLIAAPVTEAV